MQKEKVRKSCTKNTILKKWDNVPLFEMFYDKHLLSQCFEKPHGNIPCYHRIELCSEIRKFIDYPINPP
jgi:hypothetical protein